MPRLSKIGAAALAAFGWTTGGASVTASYLVVAGGGGGGNAVAGTDNGGGGGAGGYQTGTTSLNPTLSYTILVGAGGVATTQGNSSQLGALTASVGGGYGGTRSISAGGSGGSGGGGNGTTGTAGGAGTAGQGNAGGTGSGSWGAGGGGAGAVGSNASTGGPSGSGGVGLASSITGTSTFYAGGGGGSGGNTTYPNGGNGGGGTGNLSNLAGGAGTANLGGGGGGGSGSGGSSPAGGNGGSGVVIISYAGAQQFSGGIVTSVGGNTIHTFTTSGTLGPITTLSASYLIVAGGGGASFGGAGAGGLLSGSGITIDPNSTYLVTVGAGGTGQASTGPTGTNGSNSTFSMVSTAAVGGGGGGAANAPLNGASGGSGGGGGNNGTGGAGTSGQGFAGGTGYTDGSSYGLGGGGGGASAVGQSLNAGSNAGGNGGSGTASSISGTSTFYAGGGGGGGHTSGSRAGGTGGAGGGGNGSMSGNATAGTANTGGGGGGAGTASGNGGTGGSGVVIISYPGATQQMAGGTVTIVGGNVIHTFTNTGFLAPIELSTGSLRFRRSNSGYLTRTPTVSGNQQKFTFSYWFKRGTLSAEQVMFGINSASNEIFTLAFLSGNTFRVFGRNGGTDVLNLTTTQLFRDPAAWYHIVVAIDTTQATSSNRAIVYINGVQVTAFGTATYPAQNTSLAWDSSSYAHNIGREPTGNYIDGEMTELNFIDGQQLTPNSFGTFNSYGVWQPITYGGSYGTNGYYLPFNRQAVSFVGSFNGSNQYLSVANNAAFNLGSGSWTVEFWMNPTAAPSVAAGMIYKSSFSSNQGWWVIYYPNYIGFGLGSGSTVVQSAGSSISVGRWTHVAIVNNSGTGTIYINGVASGTASISSFTDSSTSLAIGALNTATGWNGDYYYNGSISNVRVVKGTAVYTSNFLPPTSALSAISGTSLLTLQNSSIVDNSTNSFTITNNNGVSTGQTYPFSAGYIFNDQGPAGNNWTPNNISGAFGSTLDYLGDAPTLTSATVANYCTLNPLNFSTGTVSNGNLQWATTAAVGNGCFSTFAFNIASSTELYYWEFTLVSGDTTLGIAPTTLAPSNTSRPGSYSYYTTGNKYSGTSFSSYGSSYTAGDVIGVAVGNGSITFYKNGVSQGVAFSSLTGTFTPAIWEISCTVSANFGQQPFKYTPPSNYVALNTYNL